MDLPTKGSIATAIVAVVAVVIAAAHVWATQTVDARAEAAVDELTAFVEQRSPSDLFTEAAAGFTPLPYDAEPQFSSGNAVLRHEPQVLWQVRCVRVARTDDDVASSVSTGRCPRS
ncbi:MAG TPA: hypothetical protein VM324_13135 [Egibacteraceae bacterium]|jgi:hypothetical protein|nr:hypothetical protein [Egibacteraceae bacterium]